MDINQGRLGTCYILAVLVNVAAHDPGRILQLVKPSVGRVRINF
jgi:hypothetical protein